MCSGSGDVWEGILDLNSLMFMDVQISVVFYERGDGGRWGIIRYVRVLGNGVIYDLFYVDGYTYTCRYRYTYRYIHI